ncbi:MAG: hypothetical protein V4672_16340 [Verrucomicrobiota bacterium]
MSGITEERVLGNINTWILNDGMLKSLPGVIHDFITTRDVANGNDIWFTLNGGGSEKALLRVEFHLSEDEVANFALIRAINFESKLIKVKYWKVTADEVEPISAEMASKIMTEKKTRLVQSIFAMNRGGDNP